MVRLQSRIGLGLVALPLSAAMLCAAVCATPAAPRALADETAGSASAPASDAVQDASADSAQAQAGESAQDTAATTRIAAEDVDVCLAGQTAVSQDGYVLVGAAALPQELVEAGAELACVLESGKTYDVSALAQLKAAYVCVPQGAVGSLANPSGQDGAADADQVAAEQGGADPSQPDASADQDVQAAQDTEPSQDSHVTLAGVDEDALQAFGGPYVAEGLADDATPTGLACAPEGTFVLSGQDAPAQPDAGGDEQGTPAEKPDTDQAGSSAAPTVAVRLLAQVALDGSDLSANQFTFRAEALDGAPAPELSEAANSADGTVDFGEVAFSAPGDYTYRLTQVAGDLASVVYDDASADVTFHVAEDEQTGALSVGEEQVPTFTNEVSVPADDGQVEYAPVTVDLATKVTLSGADLNAGEFQFKITLVDGAPEPTSTVAVNAQDGTVDFGGATFTKPGTYTYTVVQVPGDAQGMTYDDSVVTFTVTVSRTQSQAGLTAEVKASSQKGFANSYSSSTPAAGNSDGSTSDSGDYRAAGVIITASVNETGGRSVAGSMSFDVVDDAGNVVTTGTNDANGTVRFSTIELTQAGDYSYTVQPSEGTSLSAVAASGETPSYRVDVKVEDTGTGLLASVTYPDGRPTFTSATAAAKERLSSAGSAQTLDAQDGEVGSQESQAGFSPVVAVVAAVVAVALAAVVAGVVVLQGKGAGKPAHAASKRK